MALTYCDSMSNYITQSPTVPFSPASAAATGKRLKGATRFGSVGTLGRTYCGPKYASCGETEQTVIETGLNERDNKEAHGYRVVGCGSHDRH